MLEVGSQTMATQPNDDTKETARSLLQAGTSIEEVVAKTTLSKPAVLGLKGAMVKAEKRLLRAVKPTNEAKANSNSKPQIENQAETKPEEEPKPTPQSQVTSPFIHLDTQSAIAFRETLPKAQQKLFDGYLSIGEQKWQTQFQRNDGHGPSHYVSTTNNPLVEKLYQIAEAREIRDALGLNRDELKKKDEGFSLKDVLSLAEFLSKRDQPTGPGPLEIYRLARADESQIQQKLVNANNPTPANEYSLKLTEVQQLGELERDRLHWEMQKHHEAREDQRESTGQIFGIIKEAVKGPVGDLTRAVGSAAARRIEGGGGAKTSKAQCPICQGTFPVNPLLKEIQCPLCGAKLSPQPPQQPQPQGQIQEQQTENQPSPSQETQQTQQSPPSEVI